jgi:hypothetical protein
MVQYITLEFLQKHSGNVRGMGPRIVVEGAYAACQHSSPFVLNGSSKVCPGVKTRSSINCWTRRHEVDQENAFSVPKKEAMIFFNEIEVLNFFILGKRVLHHCNDCCLDSGEW